VHLCWPYPTAMRMGCTFFTCTATTCNPCAQVLPALVIAALHAQIQELLDTLPPSLEFLELSYFQLVSSRWVWSIMV